MWWTRTSQDLGSTATASARQPGWMCNSSPEAEAMAVKNEPESLPFLVVGTRHEVARVDVHEPDRGSGRQRGGSDLNHFVVMSMSNTVPLRGTSHVSVELPVRYALGIVIPANAGGSMTLLVPSSSDNRIDTL